jgi:hypothetical protein
MIQHPLCMNQPTSMNYDHIKNTTFKVLNLVVVKYNKLNNQVPLSERYDSTVLNVWESYDHLNKVYTEWYIQY